MSLVKRYFGREEVEAFPMNRGEYNNFRGWRLPEDENPADEGYFIERFDEHINWYPKDVFEKIYMPANTPLERMYIESDELMDKINKLTIFLGREDAKDVVGEHQLELMKMQKSEMKNYLTTLRLRIKLLEDKK